MASKEAPLPALPVTLASLTKFTSENNDTRINKSYPKQPRKNFYRGEYEVMELDWKSNSAGDPDAESDQGRLEGFGHFLRNLTLSEVISQGTPNPKITKLSKGETGPEATPPFLRNSQYLGWNAPAHGAEGNIVHIDIDAISDKIRAACKEEQSLAPLLEQILTDVPELDTLLMLTQTGVWGYASAGAYISEVRAKGGSQSVTDLTGVHFYFILPGDQSPDDFRTFVKARLLSLNPEEAPHAAYVYEGKNCITEARTYIDQKAIGKERLDFIAGTKCSKGYQQRRPAPEYFELEAFEELLAGNRAGLSTTKPLVPSFKALASQLAREARKAQQVLLKAHRSDPLFKERLNLVAEERAEKWAASPREARISLDLLQNYTVSGMVHLFFDESPEEPVEAWRLLLEPEEFDAKTLADPRDEESKTNKAIFYARCPQKFLTERSELDPDAEPLVAGAPAIFGFKGGEAVMQIKMDLTSVKSMMEGKTKEQMLEEYGPDWYKLIAEGNGLDPGEAEEVLQLIKARWGQSATAAQKMVAAALKSSSKKASNSAIKDVIAEFDERFSLLKSGDIITGIWEETDPLFPNATVVAQLPKMPFCEWHRRIVWDIDSKGKIKPLNAALMWWEKEHPLKYSGIVFDPSTTEKTITHVRKLRGTGQSTTDQECPEHFLNMYKGFSKEPVSPLDRPCGGKHCGGKGCLHWFLNNPGGCASIDMSRAVDVLSPNADWRVWGCEYTRSGKKRANSSCLWYYRNFYENICKGRISHFTWGLDWIADLFQNPADRKGTAFVIQGGQGTGKGQLVAPLGRIFSQHFYHAHSKREITGKFNLHLQHLTLLFADEARWGGDRSESGTWKAFITEELKGIEAKGRNIFQIRNHVRMIIASNSLWVAPTESDDRRHFILEAWSRFQNSVLDRDGKGKFDDYWWNIAHVNDEALLWDLLSLDIVSGLRTAPLTEGLMAQKMQSLTLEDQFISWMLTDAKKMFDIPLRSSEIYALLQKSQIAFNPEHVSQKGFSQSLSTKLIPECGVKVKNVGKRKERGIRLNLVKVQEWYSSRFEYEEEDDE